MRPRYLAWSILALLALLTPLWTTGSALADSGTHTALVRVVWLRTGGPWQPILDKNPWLTSVKYKQVTDYHPVPAGSHQFEFGPASTSSAGSSDSASLQASLQAGSVYTIVGTPGPQAMGSKAPAQTVLELIPDDATPMPDSAQIRIVQTNAMLPKTIDCGFVQGDPAAFAKELPFLGVTQFVALDAGTYSGPKALVCRDANPPNHFIHSPVTSTLARGSAQTFYVVGGTGDEPTDMTHVEVPELTAAAVPGNAPPPNTGEGGMTLLPLELAMLLATATAAWVAWPRRA